MPVVLGEGYVAKDKDSAFCEPSIDFKWMEEELGLEWLASSNTLEGWVELINIAQEKANESIDDANKDLITTEAFGNHTEKKSKVLNFKTPKYKRKTAENSDTNKISVKSEQPIEDTSTYKYYPIPLRSLFEILGERILKLRK